MRHTKEKLSKQVKRTLKKGKKIKKKYNLDVVISTGSTLLDLAISGGRIYGGGLPAGIVVEIFGPTGSGKTSLLCEIGGAIQRQGGILKYLDPENRFNPQFARIFDLDIDIEDPEFYDGSIGGITSIKSRSASIEKMNVGEILPKIYVYTDKDVVIPYDVPQDPDTIEKQGILNTEDDIDLGKNAWISLTDPSTGKAHGMVLESNTGLHRMKMMVFN